MNVIKTISIDIIDPINDPYLCSGDIALNKSNFFNTLIIIKL